VSDPLVADATELAGSPLKVDPETLVLRARPPRVVRFRRSVIVALTALAVGGILVAAWLAFTPRSFQLATHRDDASMPASRAGDAVTELPASYAKAPRLGPPLPGDLGPPMLDREHPLDSSVPGGAAQARQRAREAEREQRADERRRARASAVLVRTGDAPSATMAQARAVGMTGPSAPPPNAAASLLPSRSAEADPQAREVGFAAALDSGGDVNPHAIRPAASRYLLAAGSVIPASLITGLRSDLPGLAIAQVTERVYDSPTGRILLIPQGARLIGRYDSEISPGQRRAFIIWQRIVFPDGRSLRLDNMPATDTGGYAGLEDGVDSHLGVLAKGAAISTLLGVGANLAFTGENDLVEAIRESAQQNVSRAGDQLTSRNLSIPPTITIRPGTPVRLLVQRDLVLAPPAN
jgi:type IV secretion system protein VirB10